MITEYKMLIEEQQLSIENIAKNISDYSWYTLTTEEEANYTDKICKYLNENFINFTSQDNENLFIIVNKVKTQKFSGDFNNFLLDKTLETEKLYIYPYDIYLNIFPYEKQVEYIKVLNKNNYQYFDTLDFRMEPVWSYNNKTLENIYVKYFFAKNNEETEGKSIPCESFNKFIMQKSMNTFLNNSLITNDIAEKSIDTFIQKSSSAIFFNALVNKESNNIFFENKMIILLDKVLESKDVNKLDKQKIIWNIFSSKNIKNVNDVITNVFTKNKQLKENFVKILNHRVDKELVSNNEYYKDLVKENIKGLNIAQLFLLTDNFDLFNNIIKTDKAYTNILNKTIHITRNNYNYESNIFDIGLMPGDTLGFKMFNKNLKDVIKNNLIENKSHKLKDKFCTILFKQLSEKQKKDTELEIFSLLEFMSLSLLNKNMKIFEYSLNENQKEFCNKLIEFKKLNKEIPIVIDEDKNKITKKIKI